MWVAAYRHGRDPHPRLTEFPTFDAFVEDLQASPWPVVEHKIAPKGTDPQAHRPCPLCAPAWAPVRADYRANASITEVHALVLDWDHVPDPALLYQAVQPYRAVLHTTLGHYRSLQQGKGPRLRGVFPFEKPIPPTRLGRVFEAYQSFFGAQADPVSKAPAAQFYLGRYPQDPEPKVFPLSGTKYLDPWSLPGSETFTREDLRDLAKRYKRTDRRLAERFQQLHDGLPFAQPLTEGDGRDQAAYRLCSLIAEHYPTANPDTVANHFAQSLQLMEQDHPEGALTLERIREKLYRLYAAATPTEETEQTLQAQFWTAHGQPNRTGTYLPSELEQLGDPSIREWVYQAEHGVYIRTIQGFDGPIRNATVRARQALSVVPAIGARDFGPIQALASTYGSAIVQVRHSLRLQQAQFDPTTRALTLAPTPLRPLPAERSDFVDAWFEQAFTPDDRLAVERWLTLLPRLDRALSALMLIGEPDTGKNLFAYSAAKLWRSPKPAAAEKVLGRFTSDLLSCPLVWADERLPKGPDGYFPLEEFKHLLGADTFAVEQKGIDQIQPVEGYTRWLATANQDLFTSAYSHTSESNQALAQRVLRVEIQPQSATFLRANKAHLRTFVESCELARHILALPPYETEERFGIASPALERTLATGSTWGSRVCQVILTWLLKPTRTDALVLHEKALYVNGPRLYESWTALAGLAVDRPRDARQLLECLGPLLHGKERRQIGKQKYRQVDLAKLRHWAAENDWAPQETIDAALAPQGEKNGIF